MKNTIYTIIIGLITHFIGHAQFTADFSGPNLNSSVPWQGDVDLFRVSDGQLQLFDPNPAATNQATIYTVAGSSRDAATTWQFLVHLDFSPSASNHARIYLGASTPGLNNSKAYYLQVGGISGNDDALYLYRQDGQNQTELLLSGQAGGVGTAPARARVQITRSPNGLWTLAADYSGGYDFLLEDATLDSTYNQLYYFGLSCQYTATRNDRFFFDDIAISPLWLDRSPPQIDTLFAPDLSTLQLHFNEPVKDNSLLPNAYLISNGIGQPQTVTFLSEQQNSVQLTLARPLEQLREYTLSISGITDLSDNRIETAPYPFRVFLPQPPAPGELLLTELLSYPQIGGTDFIEVYNASAKVLDLLGLTIRNQAKISGNTQSLIKQSYFLLPGQYLAITSAPADLRQRYPLPDSARTLANDLPTLEADAGNVSLLFDEQLLQSFDYSAELHHPLLQEARGVSLERLSLVLTENDPQNWVSATAATGFATPGYANAQQAVISLNGHRFFELPQTTFSPDGDNFQDRLQLNYQTDQPGYLANIAVFDMEGRLVRQLVRNFSLASQGLIHWDGTNDAGQKARMGIYVIRIELFTPEGEHQIEKLSCILAGR